MFPVADARGRVVGFSARKLREDDPLPRQVRELDRGRALPQVEPALRPAPGADGDRQGGQGDPRRGPDGRARAPPGGAPRRDRADGNGADGAPAKELSRLTRRLFLCFDADNAGKEATLRGMDLAFDQGFEVRVVTLPAGQDPADAAGAFAELLGRAEAYLPYRTRLEVERARSREEGFHRAQELLARFPESPDRQEAVRLVADMLDLGRETQGALAPARRRRRLASGGGLAAPPRRRAAPRARGARRRRRAPGARRSAERARRGALRRRAAPPRPRRSSSTGRPTSQVVALLAELDARAAAAGIDPRTGEQLLLRLRERRIERELGRQDESRLPELQRSLGPRARGDPRAWLEPSRYYALGIRRKGEPWTTRRSTGRSSSW